ncbi:MAG: hypothetical protein AAF724_21780 [Pseudomonadota bacterium]
MRRTALALAALIAPTGVLAQAPDCTPFTLQALDGRVVKTHDQGDSGPSIGDLRLGERIVGDEDGNPVGELRWVITLLDPDHGGEPTHHLMRMYFLLDSGTIITEGVHALMAQMHDADRVSVAPTEMVILGGTGAFRHARGVVDYMPATDGNPEDVQFGLDISCD